MALMGLSDRPNRVRHSNQNTLELRTGSFGWPAGVHRDLGSALGKRNKQTAQGNPVHWAVGKMSMDPLAGSWEQQRRMKPGIQDANFHTRMWESWYNGDHCYHSLKTHTLSL